MAAKTPLTTKSTAGYVTPKTGVYGGVATITNNLKTDVDEHHANRLGMELEVYFFTDIDNTDTWTSGISNIVAVAWQPADATDDLNTAVLTTQATGVITFVATNANSEGWLWVLRGGGGATAAGRS